MSGVLENYVTEQGLAAEMGCCRHTIARYCREADGLPYVKVAGKKLFDRDEVRAWLKRREVRPNPTRLGGARQRMGLK